MADKSFREQCLDAYHERLKEVEAAEAQQRIEEEARHTKHLAGFLSHFDTDVEVNASSVAIEGINLTAAGEEGAYVVQASVPCRFCGGPRYSEAIQTPAEVGYFIANLDHTKCPHCEEAAERMEEQRQRISF